MKIKGTNWYTASAHHITKVDGSERVFVGELYGYRMPVTNFSPTELLSYMQDLKTKGINVKQRTSEHNHTDIPAGTPFLEVLDEKNVLALEAMFLSHGIDLPTDRYKEYGLEYIKRNPPTKTTKVKKSFLDRLLGR